MDLDDQQSSSRYSVRCTRTGWVVAAGFLLAVYVLSFVFFRQMKTRPFPTRVGPVVKFLPAVVYQGGSLLERMAYGLFFPLGKVDAWATRTPHVLVRLRSLE